MNNSLVSVIMPSYNHDKYIISAIQSIIDQTYENIELLIIDDGSIDKTEERINSIKEKCENRFQRFLFIQQENKGTCSTLNRLVENAMGEFVFLIASDDMAKPDCIMKEVQFLQSNPDYALVVGDNEFVDKDGNRIYKYRDKYIDRYLEGCISTVKENIGNRFSDEKFGRYNSLYAANYIPNGYLIRMTALKKIMPFTNDAPLEDWWLMLQLSKYWKMKFIDEVLFCYRQHSTNTMHNKTKMLNVSRKTYLHENKILKEISRENLQDDVVGVIENGVLIKKRSYLGIISVLRYRKFEEKINIVKLFSIPLFKYSRYCDWYKN